jgi:hypothetical protein
MSGVYEGTWYYNNSSANEEPTWYFQLSLTEGEAWQVTPNLSVAPSVYYINTVNTSRRTQLLPSGDPLVPPVTISTYQNTQSQDFGGGLAVNYLVTPNLTFTLGGNYGERKFGDGTSEGLVDSSTVAGNASVSYLFSQNTSAGLGVGGSRQTYENNPETNIYSAGILFGHQYSQEFRFDGILGYSFTKQSATPGTPELKSSDPAGTLNASYKSGTFGARAGVSVGYSGGSGYGQITRQGTVYLGIGDVFARNWTWSLGGSYQISRSVFVSNAIDLSSAYGTAGTQYFPYDWMSFDLTGYINRQWSSGQLGSEMTGYSALLGVTLTKTYNVF